MPERLKPEDHEFLQRLGRLGSADVEELCAAIGVTATAVRQRLNRLSACGLVTRSAAPQGRGRPRHRYTLTNRGRSELSDNCGELAHILWDELIAIEEPALRERLLLRVQREMAKRYESRVSGDSLDERLSRFQEAAAEDGLDLDVAPQPGRELPILREHNCPYHEIASRDSTICELEQHVFSEVLGAKVELTSCCQDGHACCEFEVREADDS